MPSKEATNLHLANKDGVTQLHQAVLNNNLDEVKSLVKDGATVDVCDANGQTPLHCAFFSKGKNVNEVVEYLLKEGASIFAKDRYGMTPLHQAVLMKRLPLVILLLKELKIRDKTSSAVNTPDNKGYTPLCYARYTINCPEIERHLLEGGANSPVTEEVVCQPDLYYDPPTP